MHDTLNIVDQMMELTFKDRFKIRLHLTPSHLDQNAQRQILTLLNITDIGPFECDQTILNLVHVFGNKHLNTRSPATTALHEQLILTHPFTFKGRAKGQGNIDLGDIHLQAAYLDGLLNDLVMRDIGDDMLVGTDPGGQTSGIS